jgi:hypothetical protein
MELIYLSVMCIEEFGDTVVHSYITAVSKKPGNENATE